MGQKSRELTPYESVRHFFGAELRRWREQRALSQSRLGERINFDASLIGKTEKAERMPSLELAKACDEVLATGGALARLWPLVDRERQRAETAQRVPSHLAQGSLPGPQPVVGGYGGARPAVGFGNVPVLEPETGVAVSADACVVPVLTWDGKVVFVPVDRRALLVAMGTIGGALLAGDTSGVERERLAGVMRAPERVDVEIVAYLQRVLEEHIVVDKRLGPRQLIGVVTAQIGFIEALRKSARGAVRNQLLIVGARYAEFAGWLYQDAGNAQAAAYWTDRAMEWAHEALDHVLVSYLLMRKSHQARDQQDTQAVIGLAQAAQQVDSPLPARVRALAVQEEAQGHALAGQEVICHRTLDEALELVACSHRDGLPAPGQGRYCTEVYIQLQRANAWLKLGHPQRAIHLYQTQLAKLPAVQQRDRGVYQARHAIAHAAAGDPEQAAALGHTALAIAQQTDSTRIFVELHRLDDALTPHLDLPAIAEFHQALIPT
jgi:tetratricopeptide (TPR) repeat protein/DNA-binding XRE family transcriptional regulator